ncbi:hypothetical protein U3516DRAFT_775019 [Neocallimastix sp. 'constans']
MTELKEIYDKKKTHNKYRQMTMMIKNTLSTLEYNLNDDIIWTFDTGDFEYITCNKDSLANYRQEKEFEGSGTYKGILNGCEFKFKKEELICKITSRKDKVCVCLTLQNNFKDNIKIVKLLIDYANKNTIVLKIIENDNVEEKKNNHGSYPIIEATKMNNIEMATREYNIKIVKLLIDYASKNDITSQINEQNNYKDYLLLFAASKDNIEIVKLLIDYANENKNSLLCATRTKDIELVQLLEDYTIQNGITLNLNENDEN